MGVARTPLLLSFAALAVVGAATAAPAEASGPVVVAQFAQDTKGPARTIVLGPAPVQFQAWVDASQVPTPGISVTVLPYANPACGDTACSQLATRTIWIPADLGPYTQYGFMHEIGHVFDNYVLRRSGRQAFERILFEPGVSWTDATNSDSLGTPMEWFGDAYASCAMYGAAPPSDGVALITAAGADDRVGQAQTCGLIRQAARHGTRQHWRLLTPSSA